MARTGRKRKTNVIRDAKGKSRGEPVSSSPAALKRLATLRSLGIPTEQEARGGFGGSKRATALDPLAGSSLGLLRLRGRASPGDPGGISQEQYDAGLAWLDTLHRHAGVMGYKINIRSPDWLMSARGAGVSPEAPPEIIAAVRGRYRAFYDSLMEASRGHGPGVWQLTYAVVVENRPLDTLSAEDFGAVRIGLNALAKIQRAGAPARERSPREVAA